MARLRYVEDGHVPKPRVGDRVIVRYDPSGGMFSAVIYDIARTRHSLSRHATFARVVALLDPDATPRVEFWDVVLLEEGRRKRHPNGTIEPPRGHYTWAFPGLPQCRGGPSFFSFIPPYAIVPSFVDSPLELA